MPNWFIDYMVAEPLPAIHKAAGKRSSNLELKET
jgi:hypothetical protein